MKREFFPYPKEIIKHFRHPKGLGKLEDADAIGKAGNILCGDVLWCYIKIEKKGKKEIIKDIKIEVFGCLVAIGISSLLTQIVKGKSIEEVLEMKKDDILKKTGPLPPIKVHCSVLALDALHEAIYNYFVKKKRKIPENLKKVHERIVKTLEEIEKRHKEFLKLEEKLK
ncbi:MAG: iron-sulfur cluster assembly scaffold protein [Candidatus Aenigmatarchaeota archaeon]